jgi:ATP-dependent DNA helicase RecQ
MRETSTPGDTATTTHAADLVRRSLIVDLEVAHTGRILEVGAVLGETTFRGREEGARGGCLAELARLAVRAECVLGHNLLRHDLPRIREIAPEHPILRLPVIDTLVLSPLAFPKNPYHRLVKDYKLVRESVNDPVADARQAASLFADEVHAFEVLQRTDPGLFGVLRYLLTARDEASDLGAAGLERMFAGISGIAGVDGPSGSAPSREEALGGLRGWVGERACGEVRWEASAVGTAEERMTLAYALAWLSVAGTDSVLPPWVRHAYPGTDALIRRWREVPCAAPGCGYCREVHDARKQLQRYFRFEGFRERPSNAAGGSLQRDIVEAGLRDESLLAVLPTSGGKSLGFQLPAIVRNFRRGVLTVVISPLQALMKDQVDGLVRRTGTPFAAALYGMLTPPERGAVLRRVAAGDVAILYVSPEQLRNRSFGSAVAQREIGCWVFDEAHCLSKWGHDFRPDYLYAARFIRELAQRQGGGVPPVACFTATAKREVREEILGHFRSETGRELRVFEGGVERDNLDFEVEPIAGYAKLGRLHELLAEALDPAAKGSAVVFRSKRDMTEQTAEYLGSRGWRVAHFHAGLTPPEKQRIQDGFLGGAIQVICATNAFGMGIDKDDVRLVIHADTPGSLENYLQEAGRAGRDGGQAACVLLYDEADCEDQFRLGARSELSRRDLAGILRSLRRAKHEDRDELVVTTGEILRDEELETDLELHDRNADTQVRTAVAWLERAGFLQRDENVTSVFQARLLVRNLEEADVRIARLALSEPEQALWRGILRTLFNTPPTESVTVDQLASLPEFERLTRERPVARRSPEHVGARILKILRSMEQAGLLKRDTRLNAYVRHRVADDSRGRLDRLFRTEGTLIDVLALADPEPEGWVPLALRSLNQQLLEAGCESSLEILRTLLRSLAEDGRGFAAGRGSLELRFVAVDAYLVRVGRDWRSIGELARKRQRVASVILETLRSKIPADHPARADLLVEFGFEELLAAVDGDPGLRSEVRDAVAAVERALMYLHEQRVIVLQQGLAIFRSAMTLRLCPERGKDRYLVADYEPLHHHYRERMLQVHVMAEYARRGLGRIEDARDLVVGYFAMRKEEFVRRFFGPRPELLAHATTARSFQRIVTDLANRAQIRIVTAPVDGNLLVLAGPGSGKTRTVVHRCAYLLRVERVPPRAILVCCFNRHAALELRRRLVELVGDDARGVLVQTYHGLALRLLGHSLAARRETAPDRIDFDALIRDAVELLEGRSVPPGLEPDEVRDRLLAGFRHILVDEYQDIDEPQYAMISAIAGRKVEDADQRLSILAVGDDDQNIYAFRGANVRFIRRFREDYHAEVHHLVENYRSTRYLIEAANLAIAPNTDRMKVEHPIRIDSGRELLPAGGDFGRLDARTRGRVRVVAVTGLDEQAAVVLGEIRRLRGLGVDDDSRFAVLGETHRDLAPIRALFEAESLPFRWLAGRVGFPLGQVREIRRVVSWLSERRGEPIDGARLGSQVATLFPDRTANPWVEFVHRQAEAWGLETGGTELPAAVALEFLLEACAESRRDGGPGHGIALGTVHAAKGTEHDHVLLVGAWALPPEPRLREEARRVFYVGMTRARKTLAVVRCGGPGPSCADVLEGPAVVRDPAPELGPVPTLPRWVYEEVGLDHLDLGFAGRYGPDHPVHAALAALQTGDRLRAVGMDAGGLALADRSGVVVGRFSRQGVERWGGRAGSIREIRVVAMIQRRAEQDPDPERQQAYRVEEWEYPAIELVVGAG